MAEKVSKEIPFGFYGSHHVDDIPFNYFFVSAEVVQLKSEIRTILWFQIFEKYFSLEKALIN